MSNPVLRAIEIVTAMDQREDAVVDELITEAEQTDPAGVIIGLVAILSRLLDAHPELREEIRGYAVFVARVEAADPSGTPGQCPLCSAALADGKQVEFPQMGGPVVRCQSCGEVTALESSTPKPIKLPSGQRSTKPKQRLPISHPGIAISVYN